MVMISYMQAAVVGCLARARESSSCEMPPERSGSWWNKSCSTGRRRGRRRQRAKRGGRGEKKGGKEEREDRGQGREEGERKEREKSREGTAERKATTNGLGTSSTRVNERGGEEVEGEEQRKGDER